MPNHYTSDYPTDTTVDPQVVDFFQKFYMVTDIPDAHEEYAREFTDDATFIVASRVSQGHSGECQAKAWLIRKAMSVSFVAQISWQ